VKIVNQGSDINYPTSGPAHCDQVAWSWAGRYHFIQDAKHAWISLEAIFKRREEVANRRIICQYGVAWHGRMKTGDIKQTDRTRDWSSQRVYIICVSLQ
jgi:hypothetical protein